MKKESEFQAGIIKKIKNMFPGCIILKNDSKYVQGIPDLTILYGKHWAALECKRTMTSSKRPNQEHYINKMDQMSYAKFVSPENEQEVLDGLQSTFSKT